MTRFRHFDITKSSRCVPPKNKIHFKDDASILIMPGKNKHDLLLKCHQ